MYQLKTKNYYNNLIFNYNVLNLDHLIKENKFIIFFNYNQLLNFNLLSLKNLILKENCISLVLNRKYINKIFSNYFTFLSASIFCIFILDITKFINIIKSLNNIKFFFSFNNRFSNILNKNIILDQYKIYKNFYLLHFNISKILFNIIIILLYFIINLLKYIKF